MNRNELIIKDTHRGLWYEDGVMTRILEAGRYRLPRKRWYDFLRWHKTHVDVVLVDMRGRDLTIKGQEIITSDKVAIRVSIIVQFQVNDPLATVHQVDSYEDRLYTDVQLAARRSLATMSLEDIVEDVKAAASGYGVTIIQVDGKDLIFPGDLQSILNQVLMAEARLVEARTRAETERIEAEARRIYG